MSEPVHKDYGGAKLGMWLFLFTEILLFGGMFILYAVYLQRYPQDFAASARELNVVFGTVNTVILLTSSMLAAMAVTAIQRAERTRAILFLWGTVGCALVFLANKYVEWSTKIAHGIYPDSPVLNGGPPGKSVFFSLYYVTTGIHGFHVLIGASILAWVAVRVKKGAVHGGDYVSLENSVLFWHLVDLIWIFIFPFYYLIL